ncbi:MAG: M42 family metallopeptidase [Candidatus Diapherotrites archaeon]|uniref:M42 family metallopeptidase n=1 Tax=Candidatus Iainarchaeum sp. TaxID=3101447 RepID=A0A8T4C7A2_9ARCH|nr:M42 family metallopeptidase [Candidatus Diapherotrites archaeon]
MGKTNFDMLHELMDIEAVSGNEGPVREYIHEKMKPYVDVISIDKMGDLICHKKGRKPSIMLAGHMDEIGLMVKRIEKNGKIYVSALGGINSINIIGQTVSILGSVGPVKGIMSTKEINNDYEMEQIPDINDVFVDTGLTPKELQKRNVYVGSYLSLEKTDHTIGNPDYIAGKALDDRIGCFMLIELAKKLQKSPYDIYYVFTVQEEVGLYGAKVSTYTIDPDLAVAVDVSNSNDMNDEPTKIVGEGPVITMKDDEMIGNTCLNNYFKEIARKNKVPLQLEVSNFGTTDALAISLSKGGVPTTALGVCLRNIHTTHSIASKKDILHCIDLLEKFCQKPPLHCVESEIEEETTRAQKKKK